MTKRYVAIIEDFSNKKKISTVKSRNFLYRVKVTNFALINGNKDNQ